MPPDPKDTTKPLDSTPTPQTEPPAKGQSAPPRNDKQATNKPADTLDPAPDSASLLEELLADARRVAAYGQRTGRLADSNLFYALAATEAKAGTVQWDDPAVISLQTALNRAVASIYPTTIADLRDDSWEPFSRRSVSSAGQFAFVIFSLILMGFAAYWTVQYNQGTEIIRGVQQLQKEDPRAAIGAIVRQLLRAKAEARAVGTVAVILPDEPYFGLIDRLHSYDARFQFYAPQMQSFLRNNLLLHDRLGEAWTGAANYLNQLSVVGPASAAASDQAAAIPSTPEYYPEYKACGIQDGAQPVLAGLKPYVASSDAGKMLTDYVKAAIDVLCVEGIRFMPFLLPDYDRFLQDMQQWSNALGLWYLPALYGALGATLFYMRRILDPTVPDPPLTRILHRLALGAFAGVIITWFWAPNRELAEGFTSIGLTLFTVAFLIGFCVDVLFALLDRLVTVLMDIAKGGPRPSGPVTVPAVVLNTSTPSDRPTNPGKSGNSPVKDKAAPVVEDKKHGTD